MAAGTGGRLGCGRAVRQSPAVRRAAPVRHVCGTEQRCGHDDGPVGYVPAAGPGDRGPRRRILLPRRRAPYFGPDGRYGPEAAGRCGALPTHPSRRPTHPSRRSAGPARRSTGRSRRSADPSRRPIGRSRRSTRRLQRVCARRRIGAHRARPVHGTQRAVRALRAYRAPRARKAAAVAPDWGFGGARLINYCSVPTRCVVEGALGYGWFRYCGSAPSRKTAKSRRGLAGWRRATAAPRDRPCPPQLGQRR